MTQSTAIKGQKVKFATQLSSDVLAADIVEEACALMESLLINHPFVDGNKRTAFAAFDVFLRINGKHLQMDSARLYTLIMHWIGLSPSMRLQDMIHDIRPCALE